jgi:N,N'-diacetyllegionaminate synthase
VIEIAGRKIGPGHPCFVIAELAQAHDGSLGNAHAYIDAVAGAGADAIKFQTHIAAEESTHREAFRVKFSRQDATRYDYWERMQFTRPQWVGLAAHARERGLVFLSSAFSEAAVALLEEVGMPAWKVGSGEITNRPLLDRMAATGAPMLLSSGMSSWEDLDDAVEAARAHGNQVGLFQCTTSYPCPPERIGLNVLAELRARYQLPVGLSDHSARTETSLAAVALGADMIETHVVFSKDCFGPDTSSSLTIDELASAVRSIRFVERILAHPVDKAAAAAELTGLRTLFGKSIVATRALSEGHVLAREDLACKKPGDGLPPARLYSVLGCTLSRAMAADDALTEEHLG